MKENKMVRSGIFSLAILLLFSGCSLNFLKTAVVGSGTISSEVRDVGDFERIEILGKANVTYQVADDSFCEIKVDDNLLEYIETEVVNGVLKISNRDPINPTQPLTVRLTSKQLNGGSITGSGNLEVNDLQASAFTAKIVGSGSINVNGEVTDLKASITGSGSIAKLDGPATKVDASISGSGDINVKVDKELNARITGSGSIYYTGNPEVKKTITGSGSVSQK
jgi:hypothetical protein